MRRHWRAIAVVVGIVVALAYVIAYRLDEPLRAQVESRMNAALSGYRVKIGTADFHPLGFGLDLHDVTVVQESNPDPPLARIETMAASVQWQALIHRRLVADMRIESPRVHVDLRQAQKEARDKTPVKERGWQQAVEAIYPLKINEFRVTDGDLTYVDAGPTKPLHVSAIDIAARNIRNVASPDRTYPSDFWFRATVLDHTSVKVDGRADFLAEPFAAVKVHVDVGDLRLEYLEPILAHYNMDLRRGSLSLTGAVEYGPKVASAQLENLTIRDADVDYFHTAATAPVESERAEAGVRAAEHAAKPQVMVLRAARIDVADSRFGYTDRSTDPPWRIFLDTGSLTIDNFTNQPTEGSSQATLRGALMGTGRTAIDGTFRPRTHGPDFDVAVSIEDVDMKSMNDLWRAYGGFDVAAGTFAFFSEMTVHDGRVDGYVKPLFQNVNVYDPTQDADKPLPKKVYERIVGGVAGLLENRREDAVATRTDVSGPLENPDTSTLQALGNLVKNAFFKAILPGLDRERRG